MDRLQCEDKTYLNCNTVCKATTINIETEMLYPAQLLNRLLFPGILNHELKLKVGIPVMLLRNINQSDGLWNCARMTISTSNKIHQSTDNNRNTCRVYGIYSKNSHVTNRICTAVRSRKETLSYIGLLSYDYQQRPGAISKQGRTTSI